MFSASVSRKAGGAILLAAAIGMGFCALSNLPSAPSPSTWKGYRVLLADKAVPEEKILGSLRGAGFKKVISESTEPVVLSSWAETETTNLAAALARLVPGDPRLDDYLRRLGLWFEARVGGAAYRAYYIGTAVPYFTDAGFEKKITGSLQGLEGRFVLADAGDLAPARGDGGFAFPLAALVLLIAAAAGPFIAKGASSTRSPAMLKSGRMALERFAFRLSLLLPWAILASAGSSAAALAVLWGLAFADIADNLDIPLDEYRRGGGLRAAIGALSRQGRPFIALPLTALLAIAASPGFLGSLALATLGTIAAMAGYALLTLGAALKRRFVPIRIERPLRRKRSSASDRLRGLLACLCVVIWGLGSLRSASASSPAPAGLEYPTPSAARGSSRPMPSEALSGSLFETGSNLPGISSYLTHRAFQEALPFVPVGEDRADPFAPASLPQPEGKAVVKSFDEAWARKVYDSIPSPSIEAMLLDQGPATVGRAGGPLANVSGGGDAIRAGRPLAPIECLLYIFLLVPTLARLFGGLTLAKSPQSGELRQET
jgi:hypothetical protein